MRMLIAVFENSEGKNHRWRFNNPDPNKSADEIKALLEKMTKLNLFEKDGIKLFQKVVSAKIVETTEKQIFDVNEGVTDATEESAQNPTEVQDEVESVENGLMMKVSEESDDGIKQMEVLLPKGLDIAGLSDEELQKMFADSLTEDMLLEELYYEEAYEEVETPPKIQSIAEEKNVPSKHLESSDKKTSSEPENTAKKNDMQKEQKKKINKKKRQLLERFKKHK